MRYLAPICCYLLIAFSSKAETISAKDCKNFKQIRKVSSLIFHTNEKSYALTTYWIQLGLLAQCHELTFEENFYPLKIIASDWGRDSVLFEIQTTKKLGADISDLKPHIPVVGDQLTSTLQTLHTRVLSTNSRRHSIPDFESLIEVKLDSFDSDLIGSPLFAEPNKWVGFISREYIKMLPGHSSFSEEWSSFLKPTNPIFQPNHLFVIPSSVIYYWVNSIINGAKPRMLAIEVSPNKLSSGPFLFELNCPKPNDPESPIGPIGGGQGVGVGGETYHRPFCKVLVSLTNSSKVDFPFPERENWINIITKGIRESKKLAIRMLYPKEHFWRIGGLFRLLKESKNIPITTQPGFELVGSSKNLVELRTQANRVLELTRSLYQKEYFEPEVYLLLRQAYLVAIIMSSYEVQEFKNIIKLEETIDQNGLYRWGWTCLRADAKLLNTELQKLLLLREQI